MAIKEKSDIGHAYECGGMPMHPREHSLLKNIWLMFLKIILKVEKNVLRNF